MPLSRASTRRRYNSILGITVVPDEERHGEIPHFQEETATEFGEGSSSVWRSEPSSWETPRSLVYAPASFYDLWTHHHTPGAGGSWGL